ncbi:thiol peroxidase [Geopsychrobacter electrodiphilus]|uniref:thiol peroxidase n=1 Tax=Geopsychrobacter electrodiphilus TaxID=225196 RepID=UPI000365DD5D|nr:thiol peroxidase [Geopsychrobacter electrodiphilus]
MQERTGVTRFKNNPVTLLGSELKVGDQAPDFQVVDSALNPVTLADFKGKTKIFCCVPSLDTPVCDSETRRFNQEAAQLSADIVILTISLDLPFAQKRWCAAAGIERVTVLSDYQEHSFGSAYGVVIKELKLLSRAIFIVNAADKLTYIQHVPEITNEPDYAAVLATVKQEIPTKEIPGDGVCGGY